VCHEDLETADDLSKRNGAVLLPLLHRIDVVDIDNEVLVLALIVDLDLSGVTAGHGGNSGGGLELCGLEAVGYWRG
jgi:hypothetical protein